MFETTPNLSGLLNIPDFMRDYGPLRLYWEGGFVGEGIIKYVKPCITQGTYRTTFAANALKRFYKEKFFQTVTNIDVEDDDFNKNIVRYTRFRTYKKREIVETLLTKKPYASPISIIILKNKDLCFSCIDGGIHKTVKLMPDDQHGLFWYGTWVTHMHIGDNININKSELMNESNVMGYGLVLPFLNTVISNIGENQNEENLQFFHVITNNWTERMYLKNRIEYKFPQAFGCAY